MRCHIQCRYQLFQATLPLRRNSFVLLDHFHWLVGSDSPDVSCGTVGMVVLLVETLWQAEALAAVYCCCNADFLLLLTRWQDT